MRRGAPPVNVFEQPPDYIQDRETAARTRTFIGDGGSFLRVPGCLSVERVILGGVELPAERVDKVPITNTSPPDFEEQVSPLYELQEANDGTPILVRSVLSNHGKWQAGATVQIVGSWLDDKAKEAASQERHEPSQPSQPSQKSEPEKAPAEAEKGPQDADALKRSLSKKGREELQKILGVPEADDRSRAQLIDAIVEAKFPAG